MNNEKTEQQLIDALIAKRAYFRERNRANYHKRKEAGTLKKRPSKKTEYVYKPKNLKDVPTADDVEKLKYIKSKPKQIKIDEVEYNKFLEFKSLNEKINN
jgi:hypothetical protein